MKKQKVIFIANPISGAKKPLDWEVLIKTHLDHNKFEYELHYTQSRGDATALASQAVSDGVDLVCAIGGDGTINETAQGLVNSETALAIIPRGSGNGLARHLGISLQPIQAIEFLNRHTVKFIDVGYLNDQLFLCAAGIGFDAKVAFEFDNFGKRGLFSYLYLVLKTFLQYRPINYQLRLNGKSISTPALFIAFANASQYGNNAYVAPNANISDGLLDLIIVQPFPLWRALNVVFKTFSRSLHRSKYMRTYTFKQLTLTSSQYLVHVDGEPTKTEKNIHVSIQPKSLKIVF